MPRGFIAVTLTSDNLRAFAKDLEHVLAGVSPAPNDDLEETTFRVQFQKSALTREVATYRDRLGVGRVGENWAFLVSPAWKSFELQRRSQRDKASLAGMHRDNILAAEGRGKHKGASAQRERVPPGHLPRLGEERNLPQGRGSPLRVRQERARTLSYSFPAHWQWDRRRRARGPEGSRDRSTTPTPKKTPCKFDPKESRKKWCMRPNWHPPISRFSEATEAAAKTIAFTCVLTRSHLSVWGGLGNAKAQRKSRSGNEVERLRWETDPGEGPKS